MLEAFLYLFAIYGACCFLYLNLNGKLRDRSVTAIGNLRPNEVCLVIKVKNAESTIEGLIREYVKLDWHLGRPHRLVIIDSGSTDQTVEIVQRLTYRYPYLTLAHESETALDKPFVMEYSPSGHPKRIVRDFVKLCKQELST